MSTSTSLHHQRDSVDIMTHYGRSSPRPRSRQKHDFTQLLPHRQLYTHTLHTNHFITSHLEQ
eukprot:1258317-Amphidinium_carterae.1